VLDSRIAGPSNHPGVIIGKTRYEIDMTVDELIHSGVNVNGLYVLGEDSTIEPHPDMDHYATRRNVGAVDHVDDTDLILVDAPGVTRIAASEAWLESRRDTINSVISILAGGDGIQITKELEQATFDLLGAFGRYEKTIDIAKRLSRSGPMQIANGLSVTVDRPVGSSNGRTVSWSRYDSPTFQFDQAGDKTHRSADHGLDEYGPFDVEFFAKKKPGIAVITPRAHKGIVENFMTKFLNGVQGERGLHPQLPPRRLRRGHAALRRQRHRRRCLPRGLPRSAARRECRPGHRHHERSASAPIRRRQPLPGREVDLHGAGGPGPGS
jgi:hypothetical protein